MKILRPMMALTLVGGLAYAQQGLEDPVLKVRSQRALAQGLAEGDLPPVPRAITEPPPLPAPETNYKDTRKGRASRASRTAHARKGHHHSKVQGHAAPRPRKKPRR